MKLDSISEWRKTHYTSQIIPDLDGEEVTLMGWAREIRLHSKIAFIILADREGDVQITSKDSNFLEKIKELNREDVIAVKGIVNKTDKSIRGVEVILKDLKVLNKSIKPLPLEVTEKTPAELDTRLNARILDLRKPKVTAIFKIRNRILSSARQFFEKNGFFEIETPKIIATATEGGADLFPVRYFEQEAFLRQSPQIYKELLTSAFEKVYEIGPIFRAEPSDTPRHLAEVVQMDIEMAFSTEEDTWGIMENLLEEIYRNVKKDCSKELKLIDRNLEIIKVPFEKISYTEAIDILKQEGIKIKFGEDIPPAGEKKLSNVYKKPVIVYEWPMELKPYYIHPHESKPDLSYGFDIIIDGVEIASGGRRIHNPDMYLEMIKKKGLNPEKFKEIIEFYNLGMPPHAGWAIGVDRLTMVIVGVKNIREVVLFPRDVKRIKP